MPQRLTSLLKVRRPILRTQLTLLYSGLLLGIIVIVLLATNLLYRHTATRAPEGATPVPGSTDHQFDTGPALIGFAAAIIAIFGAWWLAGRFLRPLRSIATAAQNISATNLHNRLDLAGPRDELTDLGRVLDQLFARLETAFEAQRRFVANASHELRTPLTAQRTVLQIALADPGATVESLRAACEEVLQLGTQQDELIDALLTLATSERGIDRHAPFDLAELTNTVVNNHAHQAAIRNIHLDTALHASPSDGDPKLVERLISNLVENAIIHNFRGGTVTVTTNSVAGQSTIHVSNTGPTMAPEAVDGLFQPFVRVGLDRTRDHESGHGLGLAIVQAVADAQAATIVARPGTSGGLDIDVSFPTRND
jgi:signal transduction histidine kinase